MNEKQTPLPTQERIHLEQLEATLSAAGANYTLFAHDLTIHSAEEGVEQGFGELENMAPTFILRAESGYLAAIIRGDTRLSYKKIKHRLNLKNLCLAAPEEVRQVTGAEVGYVSLLNKGMTTIIDSRLTGLDAVYGGCGVPQHTLKLNPQDLITLSGAQVFDFTEPK